MRLQPSIRRTLLWGILVPVLAFVLLNSYGLYRQALRAADTAYDRTLLASAKSIGELLQVVSDGQGRPQLQSNVHYSALEAFEADNRSRIFYKVSGFGGEMVSGFEDLPRWRGELPARSVYAALVDFYDDRYRDEPVRVAVLLQPVAGQAGQGMATIQVAETLELRRTLARQLLVDAAWQQAALVLVIALVVLVVVQIATRPVRALSAELAARPENDLTPMPAGAAPLELRPMVEATNELMARLAHLLAHQKRFVRDASHQLRTPLAVLKTQVQSALRGDVEPLLALHEIDHTVTGASQLANQMLALAKVEQLRQQGDPPVLDWAETLRAVALDVSPLIAERQLHFSLEAAAAAPVQAHEWMLRELVRNLLHNAIKYSPPGAALAVTLVGDGRHATLRIADHGPGLTPELRGRLFLPFSRGADQAHEGSGLGLAICREIVASLGGSIRLENRFGAGRVDRRDDRRMDRRMDGSITGLDALVRLPMAPSSR